MAHTCPDCGSYCTCGGDIDDRILDGTPEQMRCGCCPVDGDTDSDDVDEVAAAEYVMDESDAIDEVLAELMCTHCGCAVYRGASHLPECPYA